MSSNAARQRKLDSLQCNHGQRAALKHLGIEVDFSTLSHGEARRLIAAHTTQNPPRERTSPRLSKAERYEKRKAMAQAREIARQAQAKTISELRALPYEVYLLTPHWHRTRLAAFKRADRKCQKCGAKKRLQVHHLTYKNRGCEKPEDLLVLCEDCHYATHSPTIDE